MNSINVQETYQALSNYVNGCGSRKAFCDEFKRDHRYLQGEVFQLALEIIKTCANDDYQYDGRNEFAHTIAKDIVEKNEKYF